MVTKRRFIQGSILASLLPFQLKIHAMEKNMQARIAGIIEEYANQGIHRTGTEVDQLSANWLMKKIGSLGLEPTESVFPFQRLRPLKAALSIPGLSVTGVPLYDCHYTDATGVSGSMGDVGSNADIGVAMALPYASSESGQLIHTARQENKHKAIVIVTDDRLPPDGAALLNAENFNEPFGPPVLQVPNKHWPEIQAAIKSAASGQVVVHCDYVDATARSIGTIINGTRPELPPIVVMTPRSGWWANASERGGGIACFIEMMRGIKASKPVRDVIFTANTGHELGHTGLDRFIHDHPDLIRDAFIWIHLGANFAARHGAEVRLQYSDEEAVVSLTPWLTANSIQPAFQTKGDERPLGEARNIYDGGGRYISILGRNGLFHHPADVWPEAVDLGVTTKWVNAFVQLGIKLAE